MVGAMQWLPAPSQVLAGTLARRYKPANIARHPRPTIPGITGATEGQLTSAWPSRPVVVVPRSQVRGAIGARRASSRGRPSGTGPCARSMQHLRARPKVEDAACLGMHGEFDVMSSRIGRPSVLPELRSHVMVDSTHLLRPPVIVGRSEEPQLRVAAAAVLAQLRRSGFSATFSDVATGRHTARAALLSGSIDLLLMFTDVDWLDTDDGPWIVPQSEAERFEQHDHRVEWLGTSTAHQALEFAVLRPERQTRATTDAETILQVVARSGRVIATDVPPLYHDEIQNRLSAHFDVELTNETFRFFPLCRNLSATLQTTRYPRSCSTRWILGPVIPRFRW